MLPLFWSTPYLKSNGKYSTLGDEIGSGGGGGSVLEPLTVTENGTYRPRTGVDGFNKVTVNVSGGGGIRFAKASVNIDDIELTVIAKEVI